MIDKDKLTAAIAEGLKLRAENKRLKEELTAALETIKGNLKADAHSDYDLTGNFAILPAEKYREMQAELKRLREFEKQFQLGTGTPVERGDSVSACHVCLKCGLPWSDSAGAQRCPRCNSEIPEGTGV